MFRLNNHKLLPMNAYQMGKNRSHIVYPAYQQPKMDGNRCLAFRLTSKTGPILISRNGKPINHLQNIRDEITRLLNTKRRTKLYLDGELHIDDSHDIGDLRRVLGRKSPPDSTMENRIVYYLFDCFVATDMQKDFRTRWTLLSKLWTKENRKEPFRYLKLVPTTIIRSESDIENSFNKMLDKGYEGLVLRNFKGPYLLDGKRSPDVMTTKNFRYADFKVSGFKDAQGKDKGSIIFQLECSKRRAQHFWARPMGTIDLRRDLFKKGSQLIGSKVRVKYIEMNDLTGCVTRNPVVVSFSNN